MHGSRILRGLLGGLALAGWIGADYPWITEPALNDARDAVYLAGSSPISWLRRRGGLLEVLLRVGDPVEGLPGVGYDWNPTDYDLNDAAFYADVSGDGRGIFARIDGGLVAIARQGDPVPGAPGRFFSFVGQPQTDSDGSVVFEGAHYEGETRIRGVYLLRHGTLTKIARTGDPLPRVGFTAFGGPDWQNLRINERGDIAFVGSLQDGGPRRLPAPGERSRGALRLGPGGAGALPVARRGGVGGATGTLRAPLTRPVEEVSFPRAVSSVGRAPGF